MPVAFWLFIRFTALSNSALVNSPSPSLRSGSASYSARMFSKSHSSRYAFKGYEPSYAKPTNQSKHMHADFVVCEVSDSGTVVLLVSSTIL